MKKWANYCPDNFRHHQYLMEAELRGITDKPVRRFFDKAIDAASSNGFLRFEALANELAARYYYRRGQEKIGAVYLREAHYLYSRWGAVAKIGDLEQRYPWLLERQEVVEKDKDSTDTTITTHHSLTNGKSSSLDFSAVTKAAQTLTDEVVLEKLLVKLMDIVRENAGAEQAILLLRDTNTLELLVQAESIDDQDVRIMQSQPVKDHSGVCPGVVQFVVRTREPVVLDDAAHHGDFTMDPYILAKKPKSLLAMPINKSGKLIGILYMENNLATNVFTADRLEVLNIIAVKAAVSIENAQLYHQLEQRVMERTAQLEAAQRELIEAAHYSGMAEIATGILHNVGNILNSINTATDVSLNIIGKSRLPSLIRANNLLALHEDDVDKFIKNDPKGMQLPNFYIKLGGLLEGEQVRLKEEFQKIQDCANLIKDVIGAQQEYARAGLYTVEVEIANIIDDTLNFQMSVFEKAKIKITREYSNAPPLKIQKSKFIHILTNLFKNAVEALSHNDTEDRKLHIQVTWDPKEATYIKVRDNGLGIPKDQLNRIFTHGFTTKRGGHGFGLHTCANYMTEMGGHLIAHSDGPGHGAVFTLIFPVKKESA